MIIKASRNRIPKNPRVLLRKEIVDRLLGLSDVALRVYLAREYLASSKPDVSFPFLESLLYALGFPWLFTPRLLQEGQAMQDAAYAEIEQAGFPLETLENEPTQVSRDMERAMLLPEILPSMHESADANTLFEIPEFLFTSGACAIRKRGECEPVSRHALRLLIKLLSVQDLGSLRRSLPCCSGVS